MMGPLHESNDGKKTGSGDSDCWLNFLEETYEIIDGIDKKLARLRGDRLTRAVETAGGTVRRILDR